MPAIGKLVGRQILALGAGSADRELIRYDASGNGEEQDAPFATMVLTLFVQNFTNPGLVVANTPSNRPTARIDFGSGDAQATAVCDFGMSSTLCIPATSIRVVAQYRTLSGISGSLGTVNLGAMLAFGTPSSFAGSATYLQHLGLVNAAAAFTVANPPPFASHVQLLTDRVGDYPNYLVEMGPAVGTTFNTASYQPASGQELMPIPATIVPDIDTVAILASATGSGGLIRVTNNSANNANLALLYRLAF